MQNLIIPQPCDFVPPRFNPLIYGLFKPLLPLLLKKGYGLASVEYRGREKLE